MTALSPPAIPADRLLHQEVLRGGSAWSRRIQRGQVLRLTDPTEREESQVELMVRVRNEIVSKQPKNLRIDVSEVDQFNSGQSTAAVQYGRLWSAVSRVFGAQASGYLPMML